MLRDEIARTEWLADHGVRVPAIQRIDDQADQVVLLSSALPGAPAETRPLPVPRLVDALAAALTALHALPTADCPFDETLSRRLARATVVVGAGDVDPAEFADRNIGTSPAALLARLVATQPPEDVVVVHGDATLSNLIVDKDGRVGFVDCGNTGRGDRYADLAVLADDIGENFGSAAATRFAEAYRPQPWDGAKAAYFLDLYELF